MGHFSRALQHLDMKDVKRKRLKEIAAQKLKEQEVLDEQIYSADLLLKFEESRVGNGICNLQVIGIYDDGMEVASQPLIIKVFD